MQIIHIVPAVKSRGGITLLKDILINLPKHLKTKYGPVELMKIFLYNAKLIHTNHSNVRSFPKILKRLKFENRNNTLIHIHGRNGFYIFGGQTVQI